jgi:hypothetical protein
LVVFVSHLSKLFQFVIALVLFFFQNGGWPPASTSKLH